MIRNFLILALFLGVGFGADIAQSDIFVRQSPKAEGNEDEPEKKRSIFLRPFTSNKNKNPALRNRYGTNLNTDGLRNRTIRDMRVLAYWQQSGKKPETLEELRSYATALRARNLAQILEQREKIIPTLVSMHRKRFDTFQKRMEAQAPDLEAALAFDAIQYAEMMGMSEQARAVEAVYTGFGARESAPVKARDLGTQRSTTTITAPRIYRAPERDPEKPAPRVITNFR